jgi:hypothetical protein
MAFEEMVAAEEPAPRQLQFNLLKPVLTSLALTIFLSLFSMETSHRNSSD